LRFDQSYLVVSTGAGDCPVRKMTRLKQLLALAFAAIILIPSTTLGPTHAQDNDEVAQLMAEMSDEAIVGQLFVVTFPGSEVTDDSLVAELIRDYRIGGVVLLPANGNIINEGNTPAQVAALVGQLQEVAWEVEQPASDSSTTTEPAIPLFIAVSHEGNGVPFTGIANGTTPLPSEMALGATWNPTHAETTGIIAGQELRAMGVNMLLGPSLDVLENPLPESTGDLGVRAFGGEPFWVGQMGQAYIRGVHQGAGGRIAVVAKHFPGLGASDRSLEEEVSTVQRTLEKLKQVDLAPFFAVAQSEDPLARPDGMLVSHIRFRGLEGSAYVTTRPISVDSQALQRFMGLPEMAAWREAGGVTVSDGLGVRALRRYYDPNEESFNSRRIAQEAFLAGNDLLVLSDFALSDNWEDQAANIESTIAFFQERYANDPSFQALVNEAVARILRLKLSLYGTTPRLSAAQPSPSRASEEVGVSQEALAPIGRDAITLLSPPSPDLAPSPPTPQDNIMIFTDSRSGLPCATCAPKPYIDPLVLEETFVRLYGPLATGQISPWRVHSFAFDGLTEYMAGPPTEEGEGPSELYLEIETQLQTADWIIFAMLSPVEDSLQPNVVRRFLAEYAGTLGDPHLVVLAYDAPYYLDATEINKLSAYYAAYGRTEPFIEASVRAMFGEYAPTGFPPVNVPGIGYDLLTQISPDPAQTITLDYEITKPGTEEETPEPTEENPPTAEPTEEGLPTPEPKFETGDELRLRTSVIIDRNGHPVPDGTPVQFIFTYPQDAHESSTTAATRGGVAEAVVLLNRSGQLDIAVQADPVPRTVAMQVIVQGGEVVIQTMTPEPTETPAPTTTPDVQPTPVESPQPTPTPESGGNTEGESGMGFGALLLALLGTVFIGGAGYYVTRFNNQSTEHALRLALWSAIGGLALYLAYALRLPGIGWLREQNSAWMAWWVTLLGSTIALAVAWALTRRRTQRRTQE
jgi:beta-N-acetylhexosaminidase